MNAWFDAHAEEGFEMVKILRTLPEYNRDSFREMRGDCPD